MVPLKLSLRNFMSYGDDVPTLSLEGVRLACLSGDNGHGKSALIDAITWSLWGKARAKSDDDLIHHGQREMAVHLEFLSGGERYQVSRRRVRGRETNLQLQVATGDGWQTISGSHVRETEEKVRNLLRLDYETFINSALLLQGRADEFTTRKPAERKEVLASILGLSEYESWAETAREKGRERRDEGRSLKTSLEAMEADLVRKPQAEAGLAQVSAALRQGEEHVARQQDAVEEVRGQVAALERKVERLAQAQVDLAQAQGQAVAWQRQVAQHRQKVASLETVLSQAQAIEEGHSRLLGLRQEAEALNKALREAAALEKRQGELREAVTRVRSRLEAEAGSLRVQQEAVESKARRQADLEDELARRQQAIAALTGDEETLAKRRLEVDELAQRRALLEAAQARLREEMRDLKEKVDLLGAGDARCPVCQTELGAEGIARLRQQYEAEGQARARAFRENERELKESGQQREKLLRQASDEEGALQRTRLQLTGGVSRLEAELEESRRAAGEAARLTERLTELGATLAGNAYALAEQASLDEIAGQLAAIAYDASRHDAVARGLRDAEPFQGRYQALEEARANLPQEGESLNRAEEQARVWQDKATACTEEKEGLARDLTPLPSLRQKLQEGEEVLRSLRREQAVWQQALGAAQTEVERLRALENARAASEQAWRQAADEEGIYKELAQAFGKEGVQALLIEAALPEIEEEANRLLQRMTDNRMSLKLESQKPLKSQKGKVEETLDIHISDEYGARPYELYSGGEAFRINFALRIALAKLLAGRAGAPLSTLIIDEGFGSLDASGREKLVQAVSDIQDDFQMVLVITHLDEVKEEFPVRIEVTKTAEGSTFRVT